MNGVVYKVRFIFDVVNYYQLKCNQTFNKILWYISTEVYGIEGLKSYGEKQ